MSTKELQEFIEHNIEWILDTFVEDKLEWLGEGESYEGVDNEVLETFCKEIKGCDISDFGIRLTVEGGVDGRGYKERT